MKAFNFVNSITYYLLHWKYKMISSQNDILYKYSCWFCLLKKKIWNHISQLLLLMGDHADHTTLITFADHLHVSAIWINLGLYYRTIYICLTFYSRLRIFSRDYVIWRCRFNSTGIKKIVMSNHVPRSIFVKDWEYKHCCKINLVKS